MLSPNHSNTAGRTRVSTGNWQSVCTCEGLQRCLNVHVCLCVCECQELYLYANACLCECMPVCDIGSVDVNIKEKLQRHHLSCVHG